MPSRFFASTVAPALINRSADSPSSRYTAQCSAVAPSTCGALTSAFFCTSARRAALSPFIAASATSLLAAAIARSSAAIMEREGFSRACGASTSADRSAKAFALRRAEASVLRRIDERAGRADRVTSRRCAVIRLHQIREPPRAVALHLLTDPVQVEHAQQQVAGGDALSLEGEMTIAFELTVRAADEKMRHVVVHVLVRVPHVGAVEHERRIEQRAVPVGDRLELLGEVAERRDVIPVDIGVAADLHRILLVVRGAVEAGAGAAVREQLALRKDIAAR